VRRDADVMFGRRRTHQSGPLGELFDHGVDAVNTSLEVLIFAASQNLGMGWKTVMTLFACMSPS
jgi:ethanolaminephosphotransferase